MKVDATGVRVNWRRVALLMLACTASAVGVGWCDDQAAALGLAMVLIYASPLGFLALGMPHLCLMLALAGRDPARLQRRLDVLAAERRACFGWGLLSATVVALLFVALASAESLSGLALIVAAVALYAVLHGATAVCVSIGERILGLGGQPAPSYLWALVCGAVALYYALLIPVVGQVLVLYAVIVSLGVFRLTWSQPDRQSETGGGQDRVSQSGNTPE